VSGARHLPQAPIHSRDLAATAGVDAHWHDEKQVHSHRAYGETRLRLPGLPAERNPLGLVEPTVVAVSPLLRELLIAYTALDESQDARARRRMLGVLLDQPAAARERPVRIPAAHDARLVAVTATLEADPSDSRSLEALGREGGASGRTLTRLFRQDVGMTFPQWRTQLRLYLALRLLAEGRSVTTVGRRCGFATTSTSIDVFRRSLGHTPGAHVRSRPGSPGVSG
jgi:AraC-like DNA-binding protein